MRKVTVYDPFSTGDAPQGRQNQSQGQRSSRGRNAPQLGPNSGKWPPSRTVSVGGTGGPFNQTSRSHFGQNKTPASAASMGFEQDPFGVLKGGKVNQNKPGGSSANRGASGWGDRRSAMFVSSVQNNPRADGGFARNVGPSQFSRSIGSTTSQSSSRSKPPCRYFAQGYCKNGQTCRYSHDLSLQEESLVTDAIEMEYQGDGSIAMGSDDRSGNPVWPPQQYANSSTTVHSNFFHHKAPTEVKPAWPPFQHQTSSSTAMSSSLLQGRAPIEVRPSLQVESNPIGSKIDREIVFEDPSGATEGEPSTEPNSDNPYLPSSSAAMTVSDDSDFGTFSGFSEDESFDPYSEPLLAGALPRLPPPVVYRGEVHAP